MFKLKKHKIKVCFIELKYNNKNKRKIRLFIFYK